MLVYFTCISKGSMAWKDTHSRFCMILKRLVCVKHHIVVNSIDSSSRQGFCVCCVNIYFRVVLVFKIIRCPVSRGHKLTRRMWLHLLHICVIANTRYRYRMWALNCKRNIIFNMWCAVQWLITIILSLSFCIHDTIFTFCACYTGMSSLSCGLYIRYMPT